LLHFHPWASISGWEIEAEIKIKPTSRFVFTPKRNPCQDGRDDKTRLSQSRL